MKCILTTLSFLFIVSILSAQSGQYWSDVESSQIFLPEEAIIENVPANHRLISLDIDELKSDLANAPMEFTDAARNNPITISLPLPDGSMEEFKVAATTNMMPALAAKYPQIRSFVGVGKNLKGAITRFDYSPLGFHGSIEYNGTSIYMLPYASNQTQYYTIYYKHDISTDLLPLHSCGVTAEFLEENAKIHENRRDHSGHDHDEVVTRDLGEKVTLRTYRMAIAATAEYSNAHGGTVASVMSTFNTSINRLNLFLGGDCDVKFLLVDNTDQLIFLDVSTDPYNINAFASQQTDANQMTLDNVIGQSNYDVGHLFQQGACTTPNGNIGGQAGGQVCSNNGKARGITCHTGGVVGVVDNVMTHEIAHQFSAGHTWNNCPGSEGQHSSGSAYEPGSGTTIMSYSGACGNQNINSFGINYFHVGTIDRIFFYSQEANGSTCANEIETLNNKPEVTLNYENGFEIPISTPFQLTGEAIDEDGEDLTYCWEQYDLGPYSALGTPVLDAPIFRSYPPEADGYYRTFPAMNFLVNNTFPDSEFLPNYSRNLTFRLTARDNNAEVGGVDWGEVKFRSTATAGPFLVNFPNESGVSFETGEITEVTWDVANTDNDIVDCQSVNILMSIDGGMTYPITLACSSPNDGTEAIVIPNNITGNARIKIEAADNIFFDISNNNFTITTSTETGFGLSACSQFQQVCVPDVATVDISTLGFNGYENPVTLEVVEGLPAGLTPEFSTNPIMPGENTSISFDMTALDADGFYNVVLRGVGENADTFYQNLYFNIVFNDFSELEMLTPENGSKGENLGPDFSWIDLPHADLYDFQIATSPTFTDDVMIETATDLADANYNLVNGLEDNTLYFWRIRPVNECGRAEYLIPHAFSTFTTTCNTYENDGELTAIGAGNNQTATALLNISESGSISDVNVTNLTGDYNAIQDLELSLKSPIGTEVTLFSGICFTSTTFNIGLDDEQVNPAGFDCPPTNGSSYQPLDPLSNFDGESTQGTWEIRVRTISNLGSGGFLSDWGLEFCASFTPNSPFIVNNNDKLAPILGNTRIGNNELLVEDTDNVDYQLKYTLLSNPAHGYLTLNGETLEVGDQFSQADVTWQEFRYNHTDGTQVAGDTDDFYFVVEDGTGGWLGTPKFTLVLDETVDAEEVNLAQIINLFPNPTQDYLNVTFEQPLSGNTNFLISDIQGRLLLQERQQNVQGKVSFETANLSDGIYLITVQTENAVFTKKFTVQR